MERLLVAGIALLVLSAARADDPAQPRPSATEAASLSEWTGRPIEELVAAWGEPREAETTDGGGRLLLYDALTRSPGDEPARDGARDRSIEVHVDVTGTIRSVKPRKSLDLEAFKQALEKGHLAVPADTDTASVDEGSRARCDDEWVGKTVVELLEVWGTPDDVTRRFYTYREVWDPPGKLRRTGCRFRVDKQDRIRKVKPVGPPVPGAGPGLPDGSREREAPWPGDYDRPRRP